MWLQFAPYVKSKSRLFWKCQILTFFPKLWRGCVLFLAGAFFFFYVIFLKMVINDQKRLFLDQIFWKMVIFGWYVLADDGAFLAGAFFFFLLRHIPQNGNIWSKKWFLDQIFWKMMIFGQIWSYKWIDHINGSII